VRAQRSNELSNWTIVIKGRPTVTFAADDRADAEDFIEGRDDEGAALREDLTVLEDKNGLPLWDGESSLLLREAEESENSIWLQSLQTAIKGGEADPGDDDEWLTFLLPIADPTDEAA
jgi:hypothetical protein